MLHKYVRAVDVLDLDLWNGVMDAKATDTMLAARISNSRSSANNAKPSDCDQSSDFEHVWERIEFHGIAPLLFHKRNENGEWPQMLWDRICEQARIASVWEATHQIAIAKVIETFSAAGTLSLVMKGTALAYAYYPQAEMRRRGDTDLLVHQHDLPKAREILRKLGWTRHTDPHGLYFQENWILQNDSGFTHAIDLHWQASDRPIVQSILKTDQLFETAKPLTALSCSAKQPDLPFTLIQCVLNQHWHYTRGYRVGSARVTGAHRLIWQLDVDVLTRAFDEAGWDRLEEICEESRIGHLIAEALLRARETLGTLLPTERIDRLATIPLSPDVAALLSASDTVSEFWLDFRTTPTTRQRAKLVVYRALPPIDHLEQRYPAQTSWPTIMLRGRFLFDTALRLVRKVFGP